MTIDKRDVNKIKALVEEEKQISKMAEEDFPQYDYWYFTGFIHKY